MQISNMGFHILFQPATSITYILNASNYIQSTQNKADKFTPALKELHAATIFTSQSGEQEKKSWHLPNN